MHQVGFYYIDISRCTVNKTYNNMLNYNYSISEERGSVLPPPPQLFKSSCLCAKHCSHPDTKIFSAIALLLLFQAFLHFLPSSFCSFPDALTRGSPNILFPHRRFKEHNLRCPVISAFVTHSVP